MVIRRTSTGASETQIQLQSRQKQQQLIGSGDKNQTPPCRKNAGTTPTNEAYEYSYHTVPTHKSALRAYQFPRTTKIPQQKTKARKKRVRSMISMGDPPPPPAQTSATPGFLNF